MLKKKSHRPVFPSLADYSRKLKPKPHAPGGKGLLAPEHRGLLHTRQRNSADTAYGNTFKASSPLLPAAVIQTLLEGCGLCAPTSWELGASGNTLCSHFSGKKFLNLFSYLTKPSTKTRSRRQVAKNCWEERGWGSVGSPEAVRCDGK